MHVQLPNAQQWPGHRHQQRRLPVDLGVLPLVPFVLARDQCGRLGLHGPAELCVFVRHVRVTPRHHPLHMPRWYCINKHVRVLCVHNVPHGPDFTGWR